MLESSTRRTRTSTERRKKTLEYAEAGFLDEESTMALLVKDIFESGKANGTVRNCSCPTKEVLVRKVFIAREGLFSDLDYCLVWHPGSMISVSTGSSSVMNSDKTNFQGRTAHAVGDPHKGHGARDAGGLKLDVVGY